MRNKNYSYIPIVISGCVLVMLSFGYRAGFGLFLEPMSTDREWGRDILGLAFAIQNLAWGVFAIIAGGIADKYGNLRVLIAGILCYGIGLWGMAYSTSELTIYSTAGLLVGAGIAGTSFGIVLPALVRAVPEEKRGWALGIGTAAGSFGQFLLVPLIQTIIEFFEWFQTLQLLALSTIVMFLFVLPIAKYGGAPKQTEEIQPSLSLLEIAKKAFRVRSYVLLTFGFYVCGFHLAFIGVHMPAYLSDLGFSAYIGALSISIIGLCNIFGAYYAGIASDTYAKHKLLVTIYLSRAVAIACFLVMPTSIISILVFSAAMGFLWLSAVPPTSGLVATFFGTRYMTFLYGIVFFSHQLGSFTGVWLGAWLYENFGTYEGVWIAGIILGLIAAVLHFYISEENHTDELQHIKITVSQS
tara:strand:+ start:36 stop:1271 length:1236 start_codon:yes stop_codon:yes gene_type:complete